MNLYSYSNSRRTQDRYDTYSRQNMATSWNNHGLGHVSNMSNGRANANSEDMLDSENQRMTENLAGKVSRLKNIAFDIETDTKDSNRYLDGMDSDFDSSQGLLGGTMNRLSYMMGTGKNNRKLMCYLIAFLVGLFVVCYYLISHVRSG